MPSSSRGEDRAGSPDWAVRFIEREAFALRGDDPDRAALLFDELLSRWPDRKTSLRAYGRLLMSQRRYDAALPHWERLRAVTPDDAEPHLQLARIHARARNFADSLACAAAAVRLKPDHEEARRLCVGAVLQEFMDASKSSPRKLDEVLKTARRLAPWIDDHATFARLTSIAAALSRPSVVAAARPGRAGVKLAPSPPTRSSAPDRDRLMFAINEAARTADFATLLDGIERLSRDTATPEQDDLIHLHGVTLVTELIRAGPDEWPREQREEVELRLSRAARRQPDIVFPLFEHHVRAKKTQHALALLRALSEPQSGGSSRRSKGDEVAVVAQAFANLHRDLRQLTAVATLLAQLADWDGAVRMWRAAVALDSSLNTRRELLRALDQSGDAKGFIAAVVQFLTEASPLDQATVAQQNLVVELVRRIVQTLGRIRDFDQALSLQDVFSRFNPPSRLCFWALGAIEVARPDMARANSYFDAALRRPEPPEGVSLDIHAERALLSMRYHQYGEALAAFAQCRQGAVEGSSTYSRRQTHLIEIAEFCAGAAEPLRYPECLVDLILTEIARAPISYAPNARHVCMVSGSLGQGGGERQTLTMVRRMLQEPRVETLSLLVRSIHLKASDDFFYAEVSALPLDHVIYGLEWNRRSDIIEVLPELSDRPRLARALDLLPHNFREDVVRLCRLIWDRKPQAVHIWQDIYAAAIACVVAGVPKFFIHRGSLSPDYWEHNEYQAAVHFRIMHHSYRRLLERPDFVILNNSAAGCRTDQNWTQWPDPGPFRVVYNAVDFSALGAHVGRNVELRRSLGVPDEAPLIGGSFRIVPVKRPMYWIEAAERILAAHPAAHFLIIGDGDMTEDVANYAETHGFGDRVHLPGRVSNVGDWYRAMDLKLLTSEREGIPNALIEAQHFGVPIVATDVGGIAEAIEPGRTGHVVPGKTPAEYAAACIKILRDREWHEAAQQRAQDYVHDKFSLDNVVDELLGFYGMVSR